MTGMFELQGVTKTWSQRRVLDVVNATFATGQVTGLVGPSGAGKTTLLRILAGLDDGYQGRVVFPNDWDTDPGQVGVVFQGLSLWPHVTARGHVELVLRGTGASARRDRVELILEEVGLHRETWGRRPSQLSGGESQRVALARALASSPRLLLLDEPFAQLDVPVRETLFELLRAITAHREVTVVLVTHSWIELLSLCDDVVALVDGRVQQQGPLDSVYNHPVSEQVAELVGPVVTVEQSLIERGMITATGDHHIGNRDGLLWYRPQQVRITDAPAGRWRVNQCHIGPQGYQLQLVSKDATWEVNSTSHHAANTQVDVGIHPLP